ncbi:MAG: hypothetical protein ACHP7N_11385 [Caulobacterales bacterium]
MRQIDISHSADWTSFAGQAVVGRVEGGAAEMVDRATAARGADALALAIGEFIEDAEGVAIRSPPQFRGYRDQAQTLANVGADIAALAAAMEVLVRRSLRRD